MADVRMNPDDSVADFQAFIDGVYREPNDKRFDLPDLLSNVERFGMRGLKGIRKERRAATRTNLLISLSWLVSMMNRLHVELEDELFERFPRRCTYCGTAPCSCSVDNPDERRDLDSDDASKPETIAGFQRMFDRIYPKGREDLDAAGVHLAEEVGELSEAVLAYRGRHATDQFEHLALEAADVYSCYMGVFNAWGVEAAEEIAEMYADACHVCHCAPCECGYTAILEFEA